MKKRRTLATENTYNGYPIMTDKDKGLQADTKILSMIKDQFEYAEATKSKIFFMRLDIRFPVEETIPTDNQHFSRFNASFMKDLRRKGLKPQYCAVREQSREKHQHYHEMLFLDGQKTQSIHNHIQTAERLWRHELGLEDGNGLINDCTHNRKGEPQENGIMLRKDDPDYEQKKAECFRRASYLAKVNTKSNTPDGQREVFSSRIKRDR